MFINTTVGKKKKTKKVCKFPGCGKKFDGIGPAKYCTEHRKPKYRSVLNKMLQKKKKDLFTKVESSNQEIRHNYSSSVKLMMECGLDGCSEQFELLLLPRTFIYPKYCSKHRNAHKREMFKKTHNKSVE